MRLADKALILAVMMAATSAAQAKKPKDIAPATSAPTAAATTAPAAMSVRDGADAWQKGDYTTAVAIWRPLAQKGDGDAAFNLAQAYKLGRGVPADMAQAKTYYGQAARAGHPQAAANYGLLLFQDGDRANAMPWIQKASDAGDPRAQYVYGTALFNGDLATRNWPKAYALMARAAAAGLPQATTSLSQMDQFLSASDKQKGLAMAAEIAAKPMPPIDRDRRQVLAASDAPSPKPPSPVQRVPVAESIPAPAAPKASSPKAAKAPKPAPTAPAPAPTRPATRTLATGGHWQVQLGAYSSEAAAKTAWSKLGGLSGLSPSYEKAGAVVRLRAGGLADKAAAAKACAAAKAAGAACFPVAP